LCLAVGAGGGEVLAARIEAEMTEQELAAVPTARPNAYVHEVMDACRYLIAARTSPDPDLLKPSPHLIQQAISGLDASPTGCVLIGDSTTDIRAAQQALIDVIGYANRPGKYELLSVTGASAVITSLADLILPIRSTSRGLK
jgi:beta-phosphoglucomutase-like phosphatase (HAD superfamily)